MFHFHLFLKFHLKIKAESGIVNCTCLVCLRVSRYVKFIAFDRWTGAVTVLCPAKYVLHNGVFSNHIIISWWWWWWAFSSSYQFPLSLPLSFFILGNFHKILSSGDKGIFPFLFCHPYQYQIKNTKKKVCKKSSESTNHGSHSHSLLFLQDTKRFTVATLSVPSSWWWWAWGRSVGVCKWSVFDHNIDSGSGFKGIHALENPVHIHRSMHSLHIHM